MKLRTTLWLLGIALFAACWVGTARYLHFKSLLDWRIRPTFPANRVAESLKALCSKEYHLSVEARRQDNTLQAFFWRVGLLKPNELEMRPEAAESLERVLLCATRVALSTDTSLEFVEVKMADVLTGATVTLWRYVPDIRDSMYARMGEEEYINRLVLELDAEGQHQLGRVPHWDQPLTMNEFLAKQVVLRAKRQSPVSLQVHEDLSQPATLAVVVDNWPSIEEQNPGDKAKVADAVEKSAKTVLNGYRFRGFHGVVLEDNHGAALRSWNF